MSAERDAAAVVADVVVRLLLVWCVYQLVYLVVRYSPTMVLDPPAHLPRLDLAIAVASAMFALVIVVLIISPRAVRWLAARSQRVEDAAKGTGWVAVGLPLLAVWLAGQSLVAAAFEVHDALRFDIWARVWPSTPRIALALLLLAAAPALTRAWARANRRRVAPDPDGATERK